MSTPTYDEIRQSALDALSAGDAREAFRLFRPTLDYPGLLDSDQRWRDALTVFARVGASVIGEEFAALVRRAAYQPRDVQALYDLGYDLLERGLNGIAATVLARANALSPNQEPILTALAAALGGDAHES